jgi:hypothetical protein
MDSLQDRNRPIIGIDLTTYVVYHTIPRSSYITLTIYNILWNSDNNGFLCTLSHNKTININKYGSVPDIFSRSLFFFLGSDAVVVLNYTKILKLVIFSNIRDSPVKIESHTLPVPGRCRYLTHNPSLGVYLARFETPGSYLGGFEINCFSRSPLYLQRKHTVRQINMEIKGSSVAERKLFKNDRAKIGPKSNIFQLPRNNKYNVVKVYTRLL